MPLSWKLARSNADDTRSLQDWRVGSASLRRINSGLDTLTLGFPGVDLLGNLPFDPDEVLRLERDLGVDLIELVHDSDGDDNGAFYFLGTDAGAVAWENPITAARLAGFFTNHGGGAEADAFVDRATGSTPWTSNTAGTYVMFDLGAGISLSVSKYSIQNMAWEGGSHALRNFKLQGSNDVATNDDDGASAATWDDIDLRVADTTMAATSLSWGTYTPNQGNAASYRWLRVLQTGLNAAGDNYFNLTEFEFYGALAGAGAPLVDIPATFFCGLVVGERRGAYGKAEGTTLILAGPWHYLEKLVYQRPAGFVLVPTANPDPADPDGLQITDFEQVTRYSSVVTTGVDAEGNRIDTRDQVIEILEYAIEKGAPIAIGTIDSSIAGPRQTYRDTTCADLIIRLFAFNPGSSIFWDYSVDPPEINIRSRPNRELLTLDIADAMVREIELNPRRDLVLTGVTVNYLRVHRRTGFQFLTLEKDEAGPDPNGIGALVITLGVNGTYVIEGDDGVVDEEAEPIGIAGAIYNEYAVAPFEGRISLLADETDPVLWLSRTLAVANGVPAWAAASMNVEESVENLFPLENAEGTFFRTELTISPPRQLGPVGIRQSGSMSAPAANDNIPTNPPIPPSFPPTEPPAPPEPPHTDYNPFLYVVSNIRHSGESNTDTGELPFPPGYPGTPLSPVFVQLGGDPPDTTQVSDIAAIGASISKTARRTANGGATAYSETTHAEGEFTVTQFDLRTGLGGLLGIHVVAVKLIGTQLKSKPDGTNESTEIRVDLPVGGLYTYTSVATIGATRETADGVSFQVASASGSVSFTNFRAYTR
ncbi:MAG TPA: hypothetical protein VNP98_17440 [Chthoniobacterales bacterium]|nr:hypothetical protein [Chthoniobacterales bacterium]